MYILASSSAKKAPLCVTKLKKNGGAIVGVDAK